MRKLYICEYPYVLYKALIERMGDEKKSYSLILGDARGNLEPMVPVLRKSGLFERVEFFPSEPYKDFYDLISADKPRNIFTLLINYPRVLLRLKTFKDIEFPFDFDFKGYDKIVNSDGVYVINGYLNMNHIEYAISEHAKNVFQQGVQPVQYNILLSLCGILNKLHILIGPRSVAGFCKEVIVYDAANISSYSPQEDNRLERR